MQLSHSFFPPKSSPSWVTTCFHNWNTVVDNEASLVAQLVKNPPAMQETLGLIPVSGSSPGEGLGSHPSISGLPWWLDGKKNPPVMLDPWFGKILWRNAWPSIAVFLPGKLHWQRRPGVRKSRTGEWLRTSRRQSMKGTENIFLKEEEEI